MLTLGEVSRSGMRKRAGDDDVLRGSEKSDEACDWVMGEGAGTSFYSRAIPVFHQRGV